jgi:hypothetical protein
LGDHELFSGGVDFSGALFAGGGVDFSGADFAGGRTLFKGALRANGFALVNGLLMRGMEFPSQEDFERNLHRTLSRSATMPITLDPLPKAWLAEAWSRGFSTDEIVAACPFPELSAKQLKSALRALQRSPEAETIRTLAFRLSRLEWQARVRRTFGSLRSIPSRPRFTRAEFLADHYAPQRPLKATRMMSDWKALRRWTPEYFKQHFGDVPVKVAQGRDQTQFYDLNVHSISSEVTFGQYVDWVEATKKSNHAYLVANNNGLGGPLRALVKDIGFFGGLMNKRAIDGFVYLWYGPGGTITPLHHDTTNILFCQVRGKKRITLIDPSWTELVRDCVSFYSFIDVEKPDVKRFPYFADIPKLTVTVGPGECLFIPAGWWHFVRSLSVSVSISMTNFSVPNLGDFEPPMPGASLSLRSSSSE